jgi:hypothetical protein
MIKKTDEEIKKMIETLQKEVDSLPERNFFGDPNAESKNESLQWISELNIALTFKVLPDNKWSDVGLWLIGKFSALNDYE